MGYSERSLPAGGPAAAAGGDPLLLIPGPVTVSDRVRAAQLRDLAPRDPEFLAAEARVRRNLLGLAGAEDGYACVPLAGGGAFAVEAMLGTCLPADGKLLILVNGAAGWRMVRICQAAGHGFAVLEWPEDRPVEPSVLDRALEADPDVTHVAAVWCETGSGIVNPLAGLAEAAARRNRRFLVDAVAGFGALELDVAALPVDALAGAADLCLESVPGVGFCICREAVLEEAAGNAPSLALDLHDQWRGFVRDGQWRFVPPVQAVLALDRALEELKGEGGRGARRRRYAALTQALQEGLAALGFQPLLEAGRSAPFLLGVYQPADPRFDCPDFLERLRARGYVVAAGKLTVAETLRFACMGAMRRERLPDLLSAVTEVLDEMGVANCAPDPRERSRLASA
jgi:2-aminoethylphosphonate-pyruvate transaminase